MLYFLSFPPPNYLISTSLIHFFLPCLLLVLFVYVIITQRWIASNCARHWEYNDKRCMVPWQELRRHHGDPPHPGKIAPLLPYPIFCLNPVTTKEISI